MEDYRIETLACTFSNHAEIAEKQQQEMIIKFKENYPDQPIPEHLVGSFNVARALSVMASEIQQLKNQLLGHLRNEHPFM